MGSKSEMVIVHLGLLVVTRLFIMSSGHLQYHSIGVRDKGAGNQTPPTPQLDVSQKPWYEDVVRGVSSCTCVGLLLTRLSMLVHVVQYCVTMLFTVICL